MNRIQGADEPAGSLTKSRIDSNRLYSILLDARSSAAAENMFDITEKLLKNEKETAKVALDHLWTLKKDLQTSESSDTVDLLIDFYQNKINVLRDKEEKIKKLSTESRSLLEEKRKSDGEIATVKQEIKDCSKEIEELKGKLQTLKVKEQELSLIEMQVKKELEGNALEIVNGLYEIILSHQGTVSASESESTCETMLSGAQASQNEMHESTGDTGEEIRDDTPGSETVPPVPAVSNEPGDGEPTPHRIAVLDSEQHVEKEAPQSTDELFTIYKQQETHFVSPFPKSVVKTTSGRIMGEYYYDSTVYKNRRHYIYNSRFFMEQLHNNLAALKESFDSGVYNDLLQMIQDAYKRINDNSALHFEVSTNEILNKKSLRELWQNCKVKAYGEADAFHNRLAAKITALGNNYSIMLREQMKRLTQS
jgi:hypothetical protein